MTQDGCSRLLSRYPHGLLDLLHLGRAVLEFGNFSEWVERRIGEQIGGGLDESEWNEHDAVGDRVVLARGKLNAAAPRRHSHSLAGGNAEPREIAARETRHRAGLERIEGGRAAGHGAGV